MSCSMATGAAACLFIRWGLKLPVSAGALAMNLSTVIVHSNAQLLPRVKLGHRYGPCIGDHVVDRCPHQMLHHFSVGGPRQTDRTKNVEGVAKHENNSPRLDPGHPPGS